MEQIPFQSFRRAGYEIVTSFLCARSSPNTPSRRNWLAGSRLNSDTQRLIQINC